MKKVLILGATSAIAQAAARSFAARGCALFLVGRNAGKLAALMEDLRTKTGLPVGTRVADLNETEGHAAIIREATEFLGGLDTVLIAHGMLGSDAQARADYPACPGHIRDKSAEPSLPRHGAGRRARKARK